MTFALLSCGCNGSKQDKTSTTTAATNATASDTEAMQTTESKGEEGMLTGKWCDINGDTVIEFDGSKMYALWWEQQEERDEYNIEYEKTDYGVTYIKNANKDEYSFGIMSSLELRGDGDLYAYEEILDGEGHSYHFVPESKAAEGKAVKDFSADNPKTIESKDIESFCISLKHYSPEGLDSANYSWEVRKNDKGKYESDFTGMGSDYVVIQDTKEVDDDFVKGLQAMIDEDKLAEKNGYFFSHNENDIEYSLYVSYASGERLSIKVGSKAVDKWFIDSEKYINYARSLIGE